MPEITIDRVDFHRIFGHISLPYQEAMVGIQQAKHIPNEYLMYGWIRLSNAAQVVHHILPQHLLETGGHDYLINAMHRTAHYAFRIKNNRLYAASLAKHYPSHLATTKDFKALLGNLGDALAVIRHNYYYIDD